MIFVDSSALAKAYLAEEGSGVVRGALDRFPGRLFISEFLALEVLTTLRTAPHVRAHGGPKECAPNGVWTVHSVSIRFEHDLITPDSGEETDAEH